MVERKPQMQHKVNIRVGYKLYAALEKKAKKENKTVELIVSHALWGVIND